MDFYTFTSIVGWTMVACGIVVFAAWLTHRMHQQTKQEIDSARDLSFSEGFDDGFRAGMSALHPADPVTEVYDFEEHGGI